MKIWRVYLDDLVQLLDGIFTWTTYGYDIPIVPTDLISFVIAWDI